VRVRKIVIFLRAGAGGSDNTRPYGHQQDTGESNYELHRFCKMQWRAMKFVWKTFSRMINNAGLRCNNTQTDDVDSLFASYLQMPMMTDVKTSTRGSDSSNGCRRDVTNLRGDRQMERKNTYCAGCISVTSKRTPETSPSNHFLAVGCES
jgi:hypothetical protein